MLLYKQQEVLFMDNNLISIGARIKGRRESLNMTQAELGMKVGYTSRSSINKVELGLVDLPQSKIVAIANALDVSISYLMGWEEKTEDKSPLDFAELEKYGIMPLPKMKKLPLIGTVACGEPILAEENIDGYCNCPENIDADFCLRAKGDSMIHARIFDGDILFVHKQDIVEDGEVAAVLIEDEATVKRVYYDRGEGTLTLVPENPKFKIMRFHGEELNQIRIIGKIIAGRYAVK